jgi:hypothetical protein
VPDTPSPVRADSIMLASEATISTHTWAATVGRADAQAVVIG